MLKRCAAQYTYSLKIWHECCPQCCVNCCVIKHLVLCLMPLTCIKHLNGVCLRSSMVIWMIQKTRKLRGASRTSSFDQVHNSPLIKTSLSGLEARPASEIAEVKQIALRKDLLPLQIEWLCKMPQHRWRCSSLYHQAYHRSLCHPQSTAITSLRGQPCRRRTGELHTVAEM